MSIALKDVCSNYPQISIDWYAFTTRTHHMFYDIYAERKHSETTETRIYFNICRSYVKRYSSHKYVWFSNLNLENDGETCMNMITRKNDWNNLYTTRYQYNMRENTFLHVHTSAQSLDASSCALRLPKGDDIRSACLFTICPREDYGLSVNCMQLNTAAHW